MYASNNLPKHSLHTKCVVYSFEIAMVFCPLLKISLVNPYLKILDLAKLFVADAPIKKTQKGLTGIRIRVDVNRIRPLRKNRTRPSKKINAPRKVRFWMNFKPLFSDRIRFRPYFNYRIRIRHHFKTGSG